MDRRPHIANLLVLVLAAAAAIAAMPGCDDRAPASQAANKSPKGTATIGLIHHRAGGGEGPLEVALDEGGVLRIDAFYLVISAVEMHLCMDHEQANLHHLWSWLVPGAHAHVPTSATRLGVPYVESLLDGLGSARIIDELSPPPGRYCRAYAVLAPADDDVVNLTDADAAEIFGKTALMRGALQREEAGSWEPITWSSTLSRPVPFPLLDPRTGASPLVLDEPDDQVMLLIAKTIGPDTFAGLRLADVDGESPLDAAVDRLTETFAVHRFAAPPAPDSP